MSNSVTINQLGIRALQHLPQVKAGLARAAETIKDVAYATAPFETGHYRDSLEVEVFDEGRVRVIAKDFKSNWIEFGTLHWPAHATLRKACETSGFTLEGS